MRQRGGRGAEGGGGRGGHRGGEGRGRGRGSGGGGGKRGGEGVLVLPPSCGGRQAMPGASPRPTSAWC